MQVKSYGAVMGLLMLSSACFAQDFQHTSLKGVRYFEPMEMYLQRVVDRNGKRNAICVVGESTGEPVPNAMVYWPIERKLILWEASVDDPDPISRSRRYLDIRRDVVLGDDVHGSTYLVTRKWVDQVIAACKRYGTSFTIIKSDGRHDRR
ncbi:hypothetical protein EWE75_15465 [Sphingomonas populi]|uniref:Uncharacterized protein n=1 Tax=Sphingomonas populi TaxID=2484750 RepID=A0A4Q6Y393_9SPHN|nr:hypothetical protein [Sphingomonas populi]RZF63576.1 hypothetical protein EWE75_15465 [Sphingomonas populi]